MGHMFRADKIALVFLLLYPAPNSQVPQSADAAKADPLTKQVRNYQDTADFSTALDDFARKCGIPTGIDLQMPLKQRPLSVDVSQGTIVDVLNAIVAQEPSYKWAKVNGVINVMPEENANNILDLRIAYFHVRNADFNDIHTAIVSLPEVKTWLEQNHLTEQTAFVIDILIGKNGYSPPRVSLKLRDVTLRDIMNRIVKSPGFRFWSVSRWGERNQYLSIVVN